MTASPAATNRRAPGHGAQAALLAAMALAAWGSVGLALYTQHVLDMQPCPWCVLQRLLYLIIGALAAAGLAWRGRAVRRALAGAIVALAGLGAAAALWQHFVAARSTSCNQTLADRVMTGLGLDRLLPDVFAAYASCADAAATLLGVPYEYWSLALFLMLAAAAVTAWRLGPRARAAGAPQG